MDLDALLSLMIIVAIKRRNDSRCVFEEDLISLPSSNRSYLYVTKGLEPTLTMLS